MANKVCNGTSLDQIGSVHTTVIRSSKSEALSTPDCYHQNWSPIDYTRLYNIGLGMAALEPCSVTGAETQSLDTNHWFAGNPPVSIPQDLSLVDPLWRTCTGGTAGGYNKAMAITTATTLADNGLKHVAKFRVKAENGLVPATVSATFGPMTSPYARPNSGPQPQFSGGDNPQEEPTPVAGHPDHPQPSSSPGQPYTYSSTAPGNQDPLKPGAQSDAPQPSPAQDQHMVQDSGTAGNQDQQTPAVMSSDTPQSPPAPGQPVNNDPGNLGMHANPQDPAIPNLPSNSTPSEGDAGVNGKYVIVSVGTSNAAGANPNPATSATDKEISELAQVVNQPQQPAPGGGIQLGTSTLSPGAQTVISGHAISVGSGVVAADGTSYGVNPAPTELGQAVGLPVNPASGGGVQFGTNTLQPGAQTTVSGHFLSVGPSAVIADGTSYTLQASIGGASGGVPSGGASALAQAIGLPISPAAGGGVHIGTVALPPGAQTILSGHSVSVGPSAVVADGTS